MRFDYYSFLVDLHGGKKEQEVLFHLLSYHQKEHAFYQTVAEHLEQHRSGLDHLGLQMAQVRRANPCSLFLADLFYLSYLIIGRAITTTDQ
jgi:hypothetical protein